jgi:hypothetical protein
MKTVYLSNTGSDDYDGLSIGTPKQTLEYALKLIADGDLLQIVSGTVFSVNSLNSLANVPPANKVAADANHFGSAGNIAGTYPTTASSKAEQLAADKAAVAADADKILPTAANIKSQFDVTGTMPAGSAANRIVEDLVLNA